MDDFHLERRSSPWQNSQLHKIIGVSHIVITCNKRLNCVMSRSYEYCHARSHITLHFCVNFIPSCDWSCLTLHRTLVPLVVRVSKSDHCQIGTSNYPNLNTRHDTMDN